MKYQAIIFGVILSLASGTNGFLVQGWVEEWEYENATEFQADSRPGFRIRVTQKGFDTASKIGLDVMMAYMDQVDIPDVNEAIGNANVTIGNVRINRLRRPRAVIRNVPDKGIFASVYKVQPKITADYQAIVDWGFFGTTEASGKVTIRGKNLRFSIELTIGRNEEEEGPPMMFDAKCAFEGELNILFVGDMEDILNVGSAVFGSTIMSSAATAICDAVKTNIENNMATDLSSLPVNETADVEFDFNFGMVRFPEFNEDFVELYHRGTVYYLPDRVEPPFQPEVIPPYLNHTDKMIYIYMSDYVLNSALYAGYLSGYLAYNVTPDILPAEVLNALRTTCEEPDFCLGLVFPTLNRLYPDSVAGFTIYATNNPEIHIFGGQTATVKAEGEAIFFVDDEYSDTRNFLFKMHFDITGGVTVGVNGSTVKFYIDSIQPAVAIVESYIGDIGTGGASFQRVIGVAAEKFVIPKLTELGETGFELPKSDEVEFVNPEIMPLDVNGTFVVATNFDLSLPAELLAKGLGKFRRVKGCKRNCPTTPEPLDEEEDDGEDEEGYDDDEIFTTTTTPEPTPPRRRKGRREHERQGQERRHRERLGQNE